MKSLVSLLLFAGVGITACEPPTASRPTQNWTLTVSVSPTVVRAGSQFTASASAAAPASSACGIQIFYANTPYGGGSGSPTTFSVALTAVAWDTVVNFQAACAGAVATQTVTIQVLPVH